jgi:hypothetical protein
MILRILTDDGTLVGEIETTTVHHWRDLLLYVAGRWEADEPETRAVLLAVKVPKLLTFLRK